MDESYLVTLAHEFGAGSDSFLLQLRINLYWDKDAFDHLTEAMRKCCIHYQHLREQLEQDLREQEQFTDEQLANEPFIDEYRAYRKCISLPDWLAEGFWYVCTFVPGHTAHPFWQKIIATEPEYYHKAYDRLDHLANWFFSGQSPWIDIEKGWASTFV